MAHLDRRIDPNKKVGPESEGEVKDGTSGNSAEAAQHHEDESEIGDRIKNPDVIRQTGKPAAAVKKPGV